MIGCRANTSSDTRPVSWPMRRATANARACDTCVSRKPQSRARRNVDVIFNDISLHTHTHMQIANIFNDKSVALFLSFVKERSIIRCTAENRRVGAIVFIIISLEEGTFAPAVAFRPGLSYVRKIQCRCIESCAPSQVPHVQQRKGKLHLCTGDSVIAAACTHSKSLDYY